MFYYTQVNEWGEVTVVPTTLGIAILVVLFFVLLVAATIFAGKFSMSYSERGMMKEDPGVSNNDRGRNSKWKLGGINTKKLLVLILSIALSTLFSNIKLYSFSTGGSVTPGAMLLICLPGYLFGVVPGMISGLAYGVLQLIIDPYVISLPQVLVDYVLAFVLMGVAGIYSQKENGMIRGYIAAVFGRFLAATLSGWLFFGDYAWEGWDPLPYSLVYNGIYIFAEAVVTIIVLSALLLITDTRDRIEKITEFLRRN